MKHRVFVLCEGERGWERASRVIIAYHEHSSIMNIKKKGGAINEIDF